MDQDGVPEKYRPEPQDWKDKGWLYEHYWGEMMTMQEMAHECGLSSKRVVKESMEDHGIPRRTISYSRTNTVSPFRGFYTGVATTDPNPKLHFNPEYETEDEEMSWEKVADRDPIVGD